MPELLSRMKKLFSLTKPAPVSVRRSKKRYIVERGWQYVNGVPYSEWRGCYRTRFGSFKGRIEMSYTPKFYIHNPPEGLTARHSHKACFNPFPLLGDKWYSVHWYIQPQDIDSGVMEIERILREAYLLTTQTA
jgi:hypothetical protein